MTLGSEKPISTRTATVAIEYDCRGKRYTKMFKEAHQARAFYVKKHADSKNPRVIDVGKILQTYMSDQVQQGEQNAQNSP